MHITDALLGEHGVLYALFDHVESDLSAGGDPTPYVAILDALLRSHAHAEDELLFDEMADVMGGEGGPAAVMIQEHRDVAELLDRAARAGDDELGAILREVIALARSHFRKEEEAAFPMAERLFDPPRLREMGAAWGVRRNVSLQGGPER